MRRDIIDVGEKGMSEEFEERGYKIISDLTEKMLRETRTFYDFPADLKIGKATLVLEPDGWGGVVRCLYVEYEFDGVQYVIRRRVYSNLKDIVIDVVFDIVDHYRRMHIT